MASLEPPIPATAAEAFDVEPERSDSYASTTSMSRGRLGKWRRTIGLLMLCVVILLWTASNFLASAVLADDSFSKPYFITYINTAFFIIPLIPTLVLKARKNPEELRQWRDGWRQWRREGLLRPRTADSMRKHRRQGSASASQELLLGDSMETSQVVSTKSYASKEGDTRQLALAETFKLSFEFCILWFLANYFVAACLEYTTVASSTILTSTSSVFTLLFGVIFRVEKFTIRKLIGVLASLAGVALISSVDLSGNSSDDEHRGDFPEKSLKEIALGDALAFLSAVMYGLYAVFMKKRIADESQVNMPLFFGLVGLVNVLLLWPGFFVLHWTGIETFELPPTGRVTLILITNCIASLVADLAWAYAVLMTSPLVVTVGLSITIPTALIGQMVLNSQTASVIYWLGAIVVVLSFLFVNNDEKRDGFERMRDVTERQEEREIADEG